MTTYVFLKKNILTTLKFLKKLTVVIYSEFSLRLLSVVECGSESDSLFFFAYLEILKITCQLIKKKERII